MKDQPNQIKYIWICFWSTHAPNYLNISDRPVLQTRENLLVVLRATYPKNQVALSKSK